MCEYVYDSHEQATGSTLFIIMFVAALVPLPIINDADEAHTNLDPDPGPTLTLLLTLILTLTLTRYPGWDRQ